MGAWWLVTKPAQAKRGPSDAAGIAGWWPYDKEGVTYENQKRPTMNSRWNFPAAAATRALPESAVACFAAQMDPTLNELEDIKTAVSEAVTNAIVHAYPDTIGRVVVRGAHLPGQRAGDHCQDRGRGIADVEQARQPMFTTGGEERSGMGFTIMESFMDRLSGALGAGAGHHGGAAQAAGPRVKSGEMSAAMELLRAAQEGDQGCLRAGGDRKQRPDLECGAPLLRPGRGPGGSVSAGVSWISEGDPGVRLLPTAPAFPPYAVPKIAGEIRRFRG